MRYWTSDLHFGHVNIIGYTGRPFKDVPHMGEMLVKNWNDTVGIDDDVVIVGDFAMGKIADTLPYAGRLNGRKTLVLGNHDRPWVGSPQKQIDKWTPEYEQYFTLVDGPIFVELDGVEVQVNHFPFKSIERHGERYDEWAPDDDGGWLIHGHTHLPQKINVASREIHVGIDAWNYRPVSDDQIIELLNLSGVEF